MSFWVKVSCFLPAWGREDSCSAGARRAVSVSQSPAHLHRGGFMDMWDVEGFFSLPRGALMPPGMWKNCEMLRLWVSHSCS